MRRLLLFPIAATLLFPTIATSVVVDRVAVIVGKRVVKSSDILRDLRVAAFLNHEKLQIDSDTKRRAADRLVDQEIVRQEVATGRYNSATNQDAQALMQKIMHERFGGVAFQLTADLSKYELTEEQLRVRLQWQLTVLRFIEQRFRPGVLVTDEEVRTYYDQHPQESRSSTSKENTFELSAPKIRTQLESERIDKDFDAWIKQARSRIRVEYHDEAFQ